MRPTEKWVSSVWRAMLVVCLCGGPAAAAPDDAKPTAATAEAAAAGNPEDARRLFLAGRQAYQDGRLDTAASSFEAAYRIAALPALLFNLAQVYRRQYLVDQNPHTLRLAALHYRKYLKEAPTGPHHEAATQALAELTPIVLRVAPDALTANTAGGLPTAGAAAGGARTELMIVTEAAGAQVKLDDRAAASAPLLVTVTPGPHRAVLEAPGYLASELKLTAVEGRLVVSEARLLPRPGHLELSGDAGARLYIDERDAGRLPIGPLELPAGRHFIAVAARGRLPFGRAIEIARDGQSRLDAELPRTLQRRAVPWVAGGAVLGALATAAASVVWILADRDAAAIQSRRTTTGISLPELDQYTGARARRDAWSAGTYAAGGVTLLLAALTLGLYLFDNPEPPHAPPAAVEPASPPGSAAPAASSPALQF